MTFPMPTFMPAVSAASDPYWSNVVLLVPGGESNGSTTFVDQSSFSQTFNAQSGSSYSNSVTKFQSTAVDITGTGTSYVRFNYDNTSMNVGTQDFCIDFWVYFDAGPAGIIFTRAFSGNNYYMIHVDSTNLYFHDNSGYAINAAHGISTGTWYFVSVCRTSGTLYFHVDGVLKSSAANTTNFNSTDTTPIAIGNYGHATSSSFGNFNAKVEDFRWTIGAGRYTSSNYTPPTAAQPLA